MKKTYINPKVKAIRLRTEVLLQQTSPFPNRIDFDPSEVYVEENGIAD